ncbi:2-keto-4-pentenoate hydratase [Altererythrobacter sp. MF3-039]|uniref:2-keto-4-pentenoate hydratase n=1 Tax=Altererythrobacter sp. MF3-039 TaxID=3252901 RepID=UPI00390CDA3D
MKYRQITAKLREAWADRQPIPGESELAASPDVDQGKAIQLSLHEAFVTGGRKPIGWKLGLTSQPAMDLFGADEPMVGVIYADSLLYDCATLSSQDTISPRIEGEMLLEIGTVPQPGANDDELIASLASVSAAFEVADSRFHGWPRAIGGAIADNACCGWVMRSQQSIAPSEADFEDTAMVLTRDGESISEGRASACLGSVLEVYRWFIESSHRCGRQLKPGEIILTGAMGPAIPMETPATYHLSCPGLGEATLRFGDTP